MKDIRKRQIIRWTVSADGVIIGHAETERKARAMAFDYEYDCCYQDEPYYPKMEIRKEVLEENYGSE